MSKRKSNRSRKRKNFSKDNQIHGQLPDKEYQELLRLSSQFNCSKIQIIRYLLVDKSKPHHVSLPKKKYLNELKRSNNIISDGLNLIHDDLGRLGNLFNQAIRNENILIKENKMFYPVNLYLEKKINVRINQIKPLVNKIRKEVK